MLHENEVLDDLQLKGLVIIRNQLRFAYGHDAVLLSDFCRARPDDHLVDMGTGTGILAILIHAKTGASFLAVDIDEGLCDMARRSVGANGLEAHIQVQCADVRELHETVGFERFDGAVCNPPYRRADMPAGDPLRAGSTHMRTLTPGDMALSARRLIKNGGRLFCVFPAAGLSELFHALSGAGMEPKRVALVRPKAASAPYLALVESKKGARPGIMWDHDIILEGAR